MKKLLGIVVLGLVLSSCATNEAQLYFAIDKSDKTIGMPAANVDLAGDIKNMFRNNGWKVLIVETGSVKTKGKTGKNTELKTIAESNARYLLYLDQDHWEYCFPSLTNKLIKYDITIVDNKSGEQVFFAKGDDCRTKINEILKTEFAAFW